MAVGAAAMKECGVETVMYDHLFSLRCYLFFPTSLPTFGRPEFIRFAGKRGKQWFPLTDYYFFSMNFHSSRRATVKASTVALLS